MPLIECNNLCRSFRDPTAHDEGSEGRRPAIVDVTFAIEKGEFVAVVGPSGSGKSTLLNLLGGLDRPTSGELRIDGVDLSHASERELDTHRRDRVGFIFQSYHLNPRRTAIENVMLPLVFSPKKRDVEARRLALERLREVALEPLADRPVSTLSGGQRQRVAIARALVHAPSLLLADEPVGNLDAATGKEIVDLLVAINREKGVTILAVSHDTMLLRVAGRMLQLDNGRLQVHASTAHLRSIATLQAGTEAGGASSAATGAPGTDAASRADAAPASRADAAPASRADAAPTSRADAAPASRADAADAGDVPAGDDGASTREAS